MRVARLQAETLQLTERISAICSSPHQPSCGRPLSAMQHPAQGAHQVRCTLLTRSLTKKARGRIIYARRNCLSARGGTTRSVAGAPQRPLAYSCRRLKKMQGRSSSPVPLLNDSVNVLLDTLGGNAKRYCAHAPARRRMRALFAHVLYVAWRGPGTAARGNVCAMVAHRIAMRPSPVHAAGTPRRHRHS